MANLRKFTWEADLRNMSVTYYKVVNTQNNEPIYVDLGLLNFPKQLGNPLQTSLK